MYVTYGDSVGEILHSRSKFSHKSGWFMALVLREFNNFGQTPEKFSQTTSTWKNRFNLFSSILVPHFNQITTVNDDILSLFYFYPQNYLPQSLVKFVLDNSEIRINLSSNELKPNTTITGTSNPHLLRTLRLHLTFKTGVHSKKDVIFSVFLHFHTVDQLPKPTDSCLQQTNLIDNEQCVYFWINKNTHLERSVSTTPFKLVQQIDHNSMKYLGKFKVIHKQNMHDYILIWAKPANYYTLTNPSIKSMPSIRKQ